MKLVAEFLRNATSCLSMAARVRDQNTREELEELARQWTKLAGEREKFLQSIAAQDATDSNASSRKAV